MRRQIAATIVAFTALAVALFGVPLAVVIRSLYLDDARTRLEREALVVAHRLPDDPVALASPSIELPAAPAGVTVALYRPDGARLAGPGPDVEPRAAEVTVDHAVVRLDDDLLRALVPVATGRTVWAVLRAETSNHRAEHRAHLAWALMAALGGGVVLVAGALALVRVERLVRPLRALRDAATRLGHGDYSIAHAPSGIAELDELGEALTTTAGRLGEAMGRERAFSAHASHQLRTPLAGLRITLESELVAPRADPTLVVTDSLAIADRLERTIDDLLHLARRPPTAERLDTARLVEHVRAQWRAPYAAAGRRLDIVGGPPAGGHAMASNAAVAQAVDVLVDNALRHGTGTVTLTIGSVEGALSLTVCDAGPAPVGPAGAAATGHGIGLDLAAALVAAEGGRLQRATADRPSTYEILLPFAAG